MSDIHRLKQKVTEGDEWRETISVVYGDEELELTIRQLKDPEFFEAMSMIDEEELQALQADLPEEELERYNELRDQDDLDEEEEEEFEELAQKLDEETGSIFANISPETFRGVTMCAKKAVEPDDEDLRDAIMDDEWVLKKEDEGYGPIKTAEDCYEPFKDDIEDMVDDMTDFTSFNIGIQVLVETIGDEKNSEN